MDLQSNSLDQPNSWPTSPIACDELSIDQVRLASYILLFRLPSDNNTQNPEMLDSTTPSNADLHPASIATDSSIGTKKLIEDLSLHPVSNDVRHHDSHSSSSSHGSSSSSRTSDPTLLAPSSAPGYSVLAQTMVNSLAKAQAVEDDAIADWEMMNPSPSPSPQRHRTTEDGVHMKVASSYSRRDNMLEARASAQLKQVELLAVKILGESALSSSALTLPSTSIGVLSFSSTSPLPHSSSTSDSIATASPVTSSPLFLRNLRAVEIMTSEAKYLVGLEHVLRNALAPLQANAGVESATMDLVLASGGESNLSASNAPTLEKEEVKRIFGNLESLYVTNSNLLSSLVTIFNEWDEKTSTLGQLFAYFAPLLRVAYSVYITELSNSLANVNILCKKNAKFDHFMKMFAALKESEKRPLSDFLSTPVQRITRYGILLQALRKETPNEHPDAALLDKAMEIVEKSLKKINASPAEVERRAKIIEVQTRFAPGEIIMDSARVLILEDELTFRNIADANYSKQTVFLFTDSILTTTISYYGYLYKQHLFDLHTLVIMDRDVNLKTTTSSSSSSSSSSCSKAPNAPSTHHDPSPSSNDLSGQAAHDGFSFWLLYPMQTYIFCFPTAEKKSQWMKEIAEATATLVSKSPDRERTRHMHFIHLMNNNVPILMPIEASNDSSHPTWTEIKPLQAHSLGFFGTIWSWFTPSSSR